MPYLGLWVPLFTVAESQQMILAVGTGLDPNMYQAYPWNSPKYGAPVIPGTYTVPFPAIMAFYIDSLFSGATSQYDGSQPNK